MTRGITGTRARVGRIIGCGLLLAVGAVVAYFLLLLSAIRECNAPLGITGTTREQTMVLDAARPVIDQAIELTVNATALPTAGPPSTVTVAIERASVAPGGGPVRPVVAWFVDAERDAVIARMGPDRLASGANDRLPDESIDVKCPPGADCVMRLRVILALADPVGAGPVEVAWQVRAEVTNAGWGGCTAPPSSADVAVRAADPVGAGEGSLATAVLPAQDDVATILARHLTVTTAAAGRGPSVVRVRLVRPTQHSIPWVRVLPDDGGPPLIDQLLGQRYAAPPDATIDIPVLTACEPGRPCADGVWLVIQSIPTSPVTGDLGWNEPDRHGVLHWEVTAATYDAAGGRGPGSLDVAIDDAPADLGKAPTVESTPVTSALQPGVDQVVDVTLRLDEPPPVVDGLDPLAASMAVAHFEGRGVHVGARLEGAGASSMAGGAAGSGGANLIAHPFDECPASGPCEVTLRLVALHTPSQNQRIGDPTATWRVSLLGVPPSTQLTLSASYPRPPPVLFEALPPVSTAVLAAMAVGLALVVLDLRRRARRSQGRPAKPPML